jgi:hypothetical protein
VTRNSRPPRQGVSPHEHSWLSPRPVRRRYPMRPLLTLAAILIIFLSPRPLEGRLSRGVVMAGRRKRAVEIRGRPSWAWRAVPLMSGAAPCGRGSQPRARVASGLRPSGTKAGAQGACLNVRRECACREARPGVDGDQACAGRTPSERRRRCAERRLRPQGAANQERPCVCRRAVPLFVCREGKQSPRKRNG